MKKILLITFLLLFSKVFSQQVKFKYIDGEAVPYSHLSKFPIIKNNECKKNREKCFGKYVDDFFKKNYNKKIVSELKLNQKIVRVFTLIETDSEGEIVDIKVHTPYKELKEEAIRVWNIFPEISQAEYMNRKVGFKYTLPITLRTK